MSRHVTQTIGKAVSPFEAIGVPRTVEEAVRLDDDASEEGRFDGARRSTHDFGDGFGLTLAALAVVLIVVLLVAATLVV